MRIKKAISDSIRAAMTDAGKHHGLSLEQVSEQISRLIEAGLRSSDENIRNLWRRIPATGPVPTPEEAVGYFTAVYLGFIK